MCNTCQDDHRHNIFRHAGAGWGTGADEKDFVDVGWGSVGVKLATQCATAGAYAWMLLAPALLPDRNFL